MKQDTLLHPEQSPVIQAFGSLAPVRLGLSEAVRHRSVAALNRLLAHTMALRLLTPHVVKRGTSSSDVSRQPPLAT
jgi:hypothetical protein